MQWFFFGIAFSGVLILKGFQTEMQIGGVIYALVSTIFAGLVYITIRKIGNAAHP
jgi:drug/metabolite transporter (DMT)-like permease